MARFYCNTGTQRDVGKDQSMSFWENASQTLCSKWCLSYRMNYPNVYQENTNSGDNNQNTEEKDLVSCYIFSFQMIHTSNFQCILRHCKGDLHSGSEFNAVEHAPVLPNNKTFLHVIMTHTVQCDHILYLQYITSKQLSRLS